MLGKDHTLALRNPAVHDETKVDDEEVPLEPTAIVSKELTKDFPPCCFIVKFSKKSKPRKFGKILMFRLQM